MATLDGDLQKGTNYVRSAIPLLGISILIICLETTQKLSKNSAIFVKKCESCMHFSKAPKIKNM